MLLPQQRHERQAEHTVRVFTGGERAVLSATAVGDPQLFKQSKPFRVIACIPSCQLRSRTYSLINRSIVLLLFLAGCHLEFGVAVGAG